MPRTNNDARSGGPNDDGNDDSGFANDGHEAHDYTTSYSAINPYHDTDYSALQAKEDANGVGNDESNKDDRRDANMIKDENGEAMIGHGEFFDADGDGVFSPLDTFQGFRALGYSLAITLLSTIVICTMSYPSLPAGHWLPDPFFRIYVNGLHKAKHGSDSGSFKRDGSFNAKRFNEFWNSHTDAPHEEITPVQLYRAVAERRLAYDFYGMFAAVFEWLATWLLFGYSSFRFNIRLVFERISHLFGAVGSEPADEKEWKKSWTATLKMACSGGNIKKEDVEALYNGKVFYTIMDRQADAGNEWARSWRRKHERTRMTMKLKTRP
ncbi:Caleosin related protein-domain-containing protein [Lentinula aciculospora]|uniref:Caleosin related protein-domain-containing protein n=1 Tax=Lentinula aciculospora TaxID=153920 RepID=A0A9W9A0E3_9AGAR|nr:Caleosin related protein-domain-containing protein [Lentinula aciculospora]